MKKIIPVVMAVLLVVAGTAYAKGLEVKQKAGEYNVEAKFDRNPSVGKNNLDIVVKDGAGKYVTDAKVVVDYSMPPMPGMAPMNYKTDASLSGQKYRAVLNLSMSGPWNVAIKITKAGKTSTVKFNFDIQ